MPDAPAGADAPARLPDDALADIQGFVTTGYGHLPLAEYLFLRFHTAAAAARWLAQALPLLTTSRPWPQDAAGRTIKPAFAANVAFTADGLRAAGLPEPVLCSFPAEFQEGIAQPDRSLVLGDTGPSDPAGWEFGGPLAAPIHAVVIVHAAEPDVLTRVVSSLRSLPGHDTPIEVVTGMPQQGYRPTGDYEPFGFHDGIAQPAIRGIPDEGVPTGEFVLGYPNHYGSIPPGPVVPAALDPGGLLPPLDNPWHPNPLRDLGRHGTFVVYRKLRQDVARFWRVMLDESARLHGAPDVAHAVWLAAKCVGRWPSGAPLALAGQSDVPRLSDRDDFGYARDPDGLACPLGAHIRRMHPRDLLQPYSPEQSRSMTEAHRLLRRARVFGPPLFDPGVLQFAGPAAADTLLDLQDDGRERGIHFFCVNASIRSQFEFVQQNWGNNPRFAGLHDNPDPLLHVPVEGTAAGMTVPGLPSGIRTAGLPGAVAVRAGAYLFMPGLRALRFLTTLAG